MYATLVVGFVALALARWKHGPNPGPYYSVWSVNKFLEKNLVIPFLPSHLGWFITMLWVSYFAMTATMAVTRYTTGRFALTFEAQMLLPNFLFGTLLGCEPTNTTVIVYPINGTRVEPEGTPTQYHPHIDFGFGLHLICGLAWLTAGSLQ